MMRRIAPETRPRQRGVSIVEMMVGIAVGLFVVAGTVVVVTTQLGDNRRLLLETQVQQDLRATADIITRELRRAGAGTDIDAMNQVWAPGIGTILNPRTDITHSDEFRRVDFEYQRVTPAGVQSGPWGFWLDVDRGVIRTLLAGNNPQDLTDGNAMKVTDFRVRPQDPIVHVIPCQRGCGGDPADTSCWPTLTTRVYDIEISAEAASDPNVKRSIRSQVRVRSDVLQRDETLPANQMCPA
jgi:type IV pilus assembly protein PilW